MNLSRFNWWLIELPYKFKAGYLPNFLRIEDVKLKQECIPVGCISLAHWPHVGGCAYPAMHAPATHAPCHGHPPAMHAPCHACPPPCMPPATDALCHAIPCHAWPLQCTPPCHACPLPCMPPPMDRQTPMKT